jgi:hypothetical protein
MTGGAGVLGGVPVRRAVATERDPAFLTRAQMYPFIARFHALRTFANIGLLDGFD